MKKLINWIKEHLSTPSLEQAREQNWALEKMIVLDMFSTLTKEDSKVHKVGKHGAVAFMTKQGDICAECGRKVKR